jgi:hypothetical protein
VEQFDKVDTNRADFYPKNALLANIQTAKKSTPEASARILAEVKFVQRPVGDSVEEGVSFHQFVALALDSINQKF